MMRYLATILFIFITVLSSAQVPGSDWPLFRGKNDLTGSLKNELPLKPVLLWSLSTGSKSQSSPVISNGLIIFGNDKGMIFAIGSDKNIRWKYDARTPVTAPPLVYSDKVFFGCDDGSFVALEQLTGKPVWTYKAGNQIAGSANFWVAGKRSGLIFGCYDYCLHCLDPVSGKRLWALETENYINGTPAVSDNKIVFGGCDGFMRVVDPLTGKQRDTISIGVYIAASPALSGQKAYFGDYDGNFYCLDLVKGKIAWESGVPEGSGSIMSIPATDGNVVIIGRDDKLLYCYDASNGKLLWKFRTNGSIKGSAVISPSKVLIGSSDCNIYILSLNEGKKLWSFNAGSPISSSPAICGDRFYFLTEDGRLLAFGNSNSVK
jgi:eukaryotic-like serine/threonine-protein kinase